MNVGALPPAGLDSTVQWRKDKEPVQWVNLIEDLLSKKNNHSSFYNPTVDDTISIIEKETQTSFDAPHFWVSFESLRQHLTHLYAILSQETFSSNTRPSLASQQQDLLYASWAVERTKFQNMPAQDAGANRFFSQISFFSFISSQVGCELIEQLSKTMRHKEALIFVQTLQCMNQELFHDYTTLLSILEAAKFSIENNKNLKNTHFLKDIQNLLINCLTTIFQRSKHALIPLGWSFSDGTLGHHFLLLVENLSKEGEAIFRVMDTSKMSQKCQSISQPILSEADNKTVERSIEATRKCNESFQTKNLTDKIERLAKILMLQLPQFTKAFLDSKLPSHEIPDTYATKQKILSDIHYSVLKGDILSEDQRPLAVWQECVAPACAFSLFQPLLQTLAIKVARDLNVTLTGSEETNLKHYFELLLQSYKLHLTKKMNVNQDEKEKMTNILHRTLKDSGELISAM